jgi:hypothetical protein
MKLKKKTHTLPDPIQIALALLSVAASKNPGLSIHIDLAEGRVTGSVEDAARPGEAHFPDGDTQLSLPFDEAHALHVVQQLFRSDQASDFASIATPGNSARAAQYKHRGDGPAPAPSNASGELFEGDPSGKRVVDLEETVSGKVEGIDLDKRALRIQSGSRIVLVKVRGGLSGLGDHLGSVDDLPVRREETPGRRLQNKNPRYVADDSEFLKAWVVPHVKG